MFRRYILQPAQGARSDLQAEMIMLHCVTRVAEYAEILSTSSILVVSEYLNHSRIVAVKDVLPNWIDRQMFRSIHEILTFIFKRCF